MLKKGQNDVDIDASFLLGMDYMNRMIRDVLVPEIEARGDMHRISGISKP
jgi:hypothetical protein